MRFSRFYSVGLLSLVTLLGCASVAEPSSGAGAEDAAAILDLGEGGAADTAGFDVVEMGATGRWMVDIAALPSMTPATIENLGGVAYAFRLRLAESAAVVLIARTIEGNVNAHVVLKGPMAETLAIGAEQAVLPMAREDDGVVSLDAEAGTDYVFIVADRDLTHRGRVVVDLVVLTESSGASFNWTSPGVLAVSDALREREPLLGAYLMDGIVLEEVDGHVSVGDRTLVPLRDRNGVTALVAQVNRNRDLIYEHYGEGDAAAVGRALAQLFWVVRTP